MFLNKYKINPCKACRMFYPITDINNINYCCYDVLGAFTGKSLNEIRNSPEAQNCKDCVDQSIKSLGRDKCNMRLTPYAYWYQVPHYFPALLQQEQDKNKAYDLCIEKCNNSAYPEECKKYCSIDFNSIEEDYIPENNDKKNYIENFQYNNNKNTDNLIYLSSFTILIIIALFVFTKIMRK
jgi:hypothetical protein